MTPGLRNNDASSSAVSPEVDVRQTNTKPRSQTPLLELASAELEKLQQHQQASSLPPACLAILTDMEGNATCIDCGRNNPEWAAVSYGALVCLYCSGNHRSLGVNVSTLRSITMDHWSADEIFKMLEGGNRQLQTFFQGHSLYLDSSTQQQQFQSPHLNRDNITTMRYKTKAALFYRQQLEQHVQDLKQRGPYKGRRGQQRRPLCTTSIRAASIMLGGNKKSSSSKPFLYRNLSKNRLQAAVLEVDGNGPKPSLAYDIERLIDRNNPSIGTTRVRRSPSPSVIPGKSKQQHPPKKRPYTEDWTRKKDIKRSRNLVSDVSGVALNSCCNDDGSWREDPQETSPKPHKPHISRMQKELLFINPDNVVISSSTRSLRGLNTCPYGLRSIPSQVEASEDAVSVQISDLPSASASELHPDVEAWRTYILPLLDPLLPHPPPTRRYRDRKHLLSRDSLVECSGDVDDGIESQADFWDTLGRIRNKQVSFSWNSADEKATFLGYRKSLGRVYFDYFTLRCHPFGVGDFVWKMEDGEKGLFRIISAFQATRSFMGFWNGQGEQRKEELQKRGHVYLELVKLSVQPEGRLEVFLEDRCIPERKDTVPTSVPTWLFGAKENDKVLLEKVKVQVIDANETRDLQSLPRTMFCHRGKVLGPRRETPLTAREFDLLTSDARQLVENHARVRWYHWHRSEHVQMVSYRNEGCYQLLNRNGRHRDGVSFKEIADSSDDSDGFDEGSSNILRSVGVSGTPSGDSKKTRLGTKTHITKLWKKLNPGESTFGSWYHQNERLPHLVHHNLRVDNNSDSHESEALISKMRERYGTSAKALRLLDTLESYDPPKLTRVTDHVEIINGSAKPSEALDKIRKSLHYPPFRDPQGAVCQHAVTTDDDIYLVAPCGFGKSMCFVIPAVKSGGITLVVEPYRAQIDRQLQSLELKASIFSVEKLLTVGEGSRMKMLSAADRLRSLFGSDFSKPIIMFTTPELVNQTGALKALSNLSLQGSLRRIVIDEFDVIEESGEEYRRAYLDLFPALRKACRKKDGRPVQTMALTATATKLAVLKSVSNEAHSPPKLFYAERALPDCQSFRVERKVSNAQVAQRISWVLKKYETQNKEKPKCVCFCLTPGTCNEMAEYLRTEGIMAEVLDGTTNQTGATVGTLQRFSAGGTQVICATKALGRGFHELDIRFVFHVVMPLSLRDYIQETGRGGRDNKPSYCVLFFSHFDRGKAENVIGLSAGGSKHLQGEARTAAERHLKAVIYYATTGDKCRYSMLAECATLEEAAFPSRQECKQKCDNCAWKTSSVDLDEWFQPFLGQPRTLLSTGGGSSLQFSYCKREVTSVIADCLSQVLDQARRQSLTTEDEAEKCMRQIIGERVHQETCKELRMILFALLRTEGKSDSNKSLVTDLLRFLRTKNNKQQTTTDWPRMQSVLEAIRDKDTKFYIQNVKLLHTTISTKASVVLDVEGMPSSETLSWCDGTSHIHVAEATASFPDVIYRGMPDPWRRDDWVGGVPFLIHYEICRLVWSLQYSRLLKTNFDVLDRLTRNSSLDYSKRHKTLEELHRIFGTTSSMAPYKSILEAASSTNLPVDEKAGELAFGQGSSLYFHGRLDKNGLVTLLPPNQAIERRIFRKFGSHRFLHINVSDDVPKEVRNQFLEGPIVMCGRKWKWCWCKMAKTPQCYVLFGEKGVGIDKDEELSAEDVREWCIPQALNEDMPIGKFMKRLKLSFSKVTAAGILPDNSVELIPDFEMDGVIAEIDGGGLISRAGLNFVWREYCRNEGARKLSSPSNESEHGLNDICPYTGFQGRLGGFKGTWILDDALGDGIVMHCRGSQYKYRVPQKSLKSNQGAGCVYDSLYDTIEICSWDKKPNPSTLNTRLIQMLEELCAPEAIEAMFLKCADASTKWLDELAENPDTLIKFLKDHHARMAYQEEPLENDSAGGIERTDSFLVFLMSLAKVNPNEPVFVDRRDRLIRKIFKNLRKKAHYRIQNCCYLRMHGDHTLLLEEGEAFLAHDDARDAEGIIAMRSPSYFAGDLRKLKLVDKFTLSERAKLFKEPPGLPDALKRTPAQRFRFFENVKNALILSVKGKRSEADRMSGGDHDGDIAWTCWNKELFDIVKSVGAEDTSNYVVKKSPAEEKVVWETTQHEQLFYFAHFHGHHQHLGKLSEWLDKCIDKLGFAHDFTREVGKAAFLQVDEPYEKVKLRGDIDETKIMQMRWPHWKEKGESTEYRSQKILGKLWDLVETRLKEASAASSSSRNNWPVHRQIAPCRFQPDTHILGYIDEALESGRVDKDKLSQLQEKSKHAVSCYLQAREANYGSGKESVLKWHDKYCTEQQRKLILCESGNDAPCFAAAVLYQQAVNRIGMAAQNNSNNTAARRKNAMERKNAVEFAWGVGLHYLCRVTSDRASGSHETGKLPLPMLREMAGVLMGRRS